MWVYIVLNDSPFTMPVEEVFLSEEEAVAYIERQAVHLYFQHEEGMQEEISRRAEIESFSLSDMMLEETEDEYDRTRLDERQILTIIFYIKWEWTLHYKALDSLPFTGNEDRTFKLLKWCIF